MHKRPWRLYVIGWLVVMLIGTAIWLIDAAPAY